MKLPPEARLSHLSTRKKVQVNPGADCRIKESDALLLLGRNDLARIKQG